MPPEVFSGFVTKSRAIIKIQKSNQEQIGVTRNKYASPQTIVLISGPNPSSISEQIKSQITQMPDWVKNIFIWNSEKKILDEELINGIEFLVKLKVVQLN